MTSIYGKPQIDLKLMMPHGNAAQLSDAKDQDTKDLEGAANQFESILLKMFLDQARESKLSDDLLGSSASDNFQEMFDSELSQAGGASMNLGLTEVIVRQLRNDLGK